MAFEQLIVLLVFVVFSLLQWLFRRVGSHARRTPPLSATPWSPTAPDEVPATSAATSPPPSSRRVPSLPESSARGALPTEPRRSAQALAHRRQERARSGLTRPARQGSSVATATDQRRRPLERSLRDPEELRRAVILMTVLGPPRSLDPPRYDP